MLAAQKPIIRPVGRLQICFISDVGNWVGCRVDICPKADSLSTPQPQAAGEGFYGEGATCRNSTVSSGSHLEIGHQWSDQHHLGCSRDSSSIVPGSVCFHFFEATSRNCGSLCCGYSLVITQLTSPPAYQTGVYTTAHRIWLRILSIALEKE